MEVNKMIRSKKEIEIFKHGEWIKVLAIISEELLCKNPVCNRKPKGNSQSNKNSISHYCSSMCAQQDIWRRKNV